MSEDIFVPSSKSDTSISGPLHTITYVTADTDTVHRALSEGLGLSSSSEHSPGTEECLAINAYLGFAEDDRWTSRSYFRNDAGRNVQIRVIGVSENNSIIRPEIDGTYNGGLSIGFPMSNIEDREEHMNGIGIQSSVGLKTIEFSSPAGEVYTSGEIHFLAPDNVFLLGVFRPEQFVPVGPMNISKNIGAAAYSARCAQNTDQLMQFYRNVLGYEIRRDMTMTVGHKSGLRLKEGITERFIQLFAPGASTGYLVFLDYDGEAKASPAPSLGPPNRGIAMWSFSTKRLDEIYDRAVKAGAKILYAPATRSSPFLPTTRTMIFEDPGGYPLEFFEDNT